MTNQVIWARTRWAAVRVGVEMVAWGDLGGFWAVSGFASDFKFFS